MNKEKVIKLFNSGAEFNVRENRFYHPSFRKGWRKMFASNISLQAAENVLKDRLVTVNGITKLA